MRRVVDGLVTRANYAASMRRGLLTLLVTIALAVSGLASAGAAAACPMQSQEVHACCPDEAPGKEGPVQAPHDMECCLSGPACRAAFSPAALEQEDRTPAVVIETGPVLVDDGAPLGGLLNEYWRPPRIV